MLKKKKIYKILKKKKPLIFYIYKTEDIKYIIDNFMGFEFTKMNIETYGWSNKEFWYKITMLENRKCDWVDFLEISKIRIPPIKDENTLD